MVSFGRDHVGVHVEGSLGGAIDAPARIGPPGGAARNMDDPHRCSSRALTQNGIGEGHRGRHVEVHAAGDLADGLASSHLHRGDRSSIVDEQYLGGVPEECGQIPRVQPGRQLAGRAEIDPSTSRAGHPEHGPAFGLQAGRHRLPQAPAMAGDNGLPHGLTDPDEGRARPLRKTLRNTPTSSLIRTARGRVAGISLKMIARIEVSGTARIAPVIPHTADQNDSATSTTKRHR